MGPSHPTDSLTSLHEQLPATAHSVAAARRAVRRFAADLEVDLDGVVLAVSEAVANVVTHAYERGAEGSVELVASASRVEVTVEVRDKAAGSAAARRPAPASGSRSSAGWRSTCRSPTRRRASR